MKAIRLLESRKVIWNDLSAQLGPEYLSTLWEIIQEEDVLRNGFVGNNDEDDDYVDRPDGGGALVRVKYDMRDTCRELLE